MFPKAMYRLLPSLFVILLLGACTIYRPDILQGNVVTQEAVDQLRPGMTRNQVRFLMGSPLINDTFHPERWDYYYSRYKGVEKTTERRHVAVVFAGESVVRIERDDAGNTDTAAVSP